MGPIWGIDLGGTKIEGVVIEDIENMNVLKRMRLPTEADKGYVHIIRQIYKLVETLVAEIGMRPEMIGIGTPGTLSPSTQKLKNSNTVCLNGKPFKSDIENLLKIPVAMANDANCFALAETKLGIVKEVKPDAKVVWGTIMGTGVGSGLVIDGKILSGLHGIGGEWGHMFCDESGGECYCGKVGCLEQVISGPALTRYYNELLGTSLKLPEIVERYYGGMDNRATETMERLIYFFGRSAANVINVLDPDVVVLGGGLGNIDLLYTAGVESVRQHIFNDKLETLFLKPKLGDSAGVFGAALLCLA
ncbi:MAG: ROK family protein [Bacteroidota bacterium]